MGRRGRDIRPVEIVTTRRGVDAVDANEEETLAERGEEAMALEAILEEDFKIVEENKLWRVKVTLEEDANGVLWEPCNSKSIFRRIICIQPRLRYSWCVTTSYHWSFVDR